MIEAPGYTDDEKVDIVRRTLWRDQLEVAGLSATGFWTRTPTAGHRAGPETGRRVTVEVLDGETAAVSRPGSIEMTDAAVLAVIRCHTCEAGVGQLGLCRYRHLDRRGPRREVARPRGERVLRLLADRRVRQHPGRSAAHVRGATPTPSTCSTITNTPRSLLASAERRGSPGILAE